MSPQGTGVPCRSPLPASWEPHRLNPHKSLQYKALSSSTEVSLDLDHPLSSKPQDTPCLTGTGWPHTQHPAHCSAAFWDVPAASPYSTCQHFSLLSPGGHRQRMSVLGKQESPHWAPQDFSVCSANVCMLWFVICLSPQAGFPCFSKQFSNRCWDVFPTWSKALALPTHAKKPGKSRTPNQALMCHPSTAGCCHRRVFHNKIPSIITSHQKHVIAHCIYIYGNILCQHRSKIKQLCLLIGRLTVPPRVLQQGSAEESLPGLMPSAINSSQCLQRHREPL